jgi:lipoprotein-anchoring transpeptidase ErfK/SrfK
LFANAEKPLHRGVDCRHRRGAAAWPSRRRGSFDQNQQVGPAYAVTADGKHIHNWPVSTGRRGYDTPSGRFKPFRMEIDHYSKEWDNAPMPYSIFFTKSGNAVHGTYERRHLGRAVSHGCVRLSVKDAATLWQLVKQEKIDNTTVVVTD